MKWQSKDGSKPTGEGDKFIDNLYLVKTIAKYEPYYIQLATWDENENNFYPEPEYSSHPIDSNEIIEWVCLKDFIEHLDKNEQNV